MLKKFRGRHIKRILLGLLVVIVPSFVFWGISSFVKRKEEDTPIIIDGHPIDAAEFKDYIRTANIFYRLTMGEDFFTKINQPIVEAKAFELVLLLWKAKKDGLKASDEEVVKMIKKAFSPYGGFDKDLYSRYVREALFMSPRAFEEHIRKILTADLVIDKYTKTIEVTDEEIKDLYKLDNEKVKISLIYIAYKKFDKDTDLNDKEVSEYYQKHKDLFKNEPKMKIRYIILDKNRDQKTIDNIYKDLDKIQSLKTIADKFSLKAHEVLSSEKTTTIPGVERNQRLNDLILSLPLKTLSPLVELQNAYIIFEKVERIKGGTPPLEEIKEKVMEYVLKDKKKDKAKALGEKILEIALTKRASKLKRLAKKYDLEYKNTGYFGRTDIIEELEWDEKIYEVIFNLKKGELHKDVFLKSEGAYIIRLDDFILIDEDKFEEEKETYRINMRTQRSFIKRINFLSQLEKEAQVKNFRQDYR